jgi:hypothetical protein
LTLDFDAIIINIWPLPADKILMIAGGSFGYRCTIAAFEAASDTNITPIFHTVGHI